MKQKVYTFLSGGKIDTLESFNAIPPSPGNSKPAPSNASENIKTDNISVQIPVSNRSDDEHGMEKTNVVVTRPDNDFSSLDSEWGSDSLESGWHDPEEDRIEDPKKQGDPGKDPEEDEADEEDPEEDEEDDYFNIIIDLLKKIDRNTRKRKINKKKKKKKKHGGRRTKRKSRRRTKRRTKR